jgi:hypothetical protein
VGGFALGDIISITLDNKTFDIPYYDGYYALTVSKDPQ